MRISEVARRSGVSARMLRYYDRLGLVTPSSRTSGGYREYAERDLWRLLRVEGLRSLGLGLAEVGAALDGVAASGEGAASREGAAHSRDAARGGSAGPGELIEELIARTRERIAVEQRLLERLEQLDSTAPSDWEQVLEVVRLVRGLESPHASDRQRAALDSAAEPRSAKPVQALVAALLAEEDENAAGALRWAIARSAESPAVLAHALDDSDPRRRTRAIAAVAEFGDEASAVLLRRALDDPEPRNRAAAALVLGARGDALASEALIELVLSGDRDVEAAEALGRIARDPNAGRVITAAYAAHVEDADPAVRARIAQASAELEGAEVGAMLERLAADPERNVARIAEYLLARAAPGSGGA